MLRLQVLLLQLYLHKFQRPCIPSSSISNRYIDSEIAC
jgi:hypothetical protein